FTGQPETLRSGKSIEKVCTVQGGEDSMKSSFKGITIVFILMLSLQCIVQPDGVSSQIHKAIAETEQKSKVPSIHKSLLTVEPDKIEGTNAETDDVNEPGWGLAGS
ncbi:MAG: hypothetical protein WCD89_12305, partial [Anaerocolumna sp.]